MNRSDRSTVALGSIAAIAAGLFIIATGTVDPAAPAYAVQPAPVTQPVTSTGVVTPAGAVWALDATPVHATKPKPEPEPASARTTPAPDRIRVFHDDHSWVNYTTGQSGCIPGGYCDDTVAVPHRITIHEDHSWTNHTRRTTGCIPGGYCSL